MLFVIFSGRPDLHLCINKRDNNIFINLGIGRRVKESGAYPPEKPPSSQIFMR